MSLTIGIPSKGINASLIGAINHALTLHPSEIIVAINPGKNETDLPSLFRDNPSIHFFFHQRDLGLYGNFRFLIRQAKSRFFCFNCVDDRVCPQAMEVVSENDCDLVIPSWVWAEYYPMDISHDRHWEKGPMPSIETNSAKVKSSIYAEPSWIFGIWKTKFLLDIFPKHNFDWLDVYLLQTTILTGNILVRNMQLPTIIGTWNWANRPPNSVNGKKHNLTLYLLFSLKNFLRFLKLNPKCWKELVLYLRHLFLQTKSLNNSKVRAQ